MRFCERVDLGKSASWLIVHFAYVQFETRGSRSLDESS